MRAGAIRRAIGPARCGVLKTGAKVPTAQPAKARSGGGAHARNGRIKGTGSRVRQALNSFAVAVAIAGQVATAGWPIQARAQITIDQGVLDRLGPPRPSAPPPAAGPGMSGLPLAPADGQLVAGPDRRGTRPPPRRASRPRATQPPPQTAVATPPIGPEAAGDAEAAPAASQAAVVPLPVPPEWVPPPPLPAPPVAPGPPPLVAAAPIPPPPAPQAATPQSPAPQAAPAATPGAPPPVRPQLPAAGQPAPPVALPAAAPPSPALPAPASPAPAPTAVATTPARVAAAPAPSPQPPAGAAVARAPAPASPAAPAALKLAFRPGDSTMAAEARARLASFARDVPADESGTRVIIVGFGDDAEGDSSRARRLALARAIEARSVLLAGGIRSTRIDVRAMGKPTDGSDPDRVEVSLATSGGAAQR